MTTLEEDIRVFRGYFESLAANLQSGDAEFTSASPQHNFNAFHEVGRNIANRHGIRRESVLELAGISPEEYSDVRGQGFSAGHGFWERAAENFEIDQRRAAARHSLIRIFETQGEGLTAGQVSQVRIDLYKGGIRLDFGQRAQLKLLDLKLRRKWFPIGPPPKWVLEL